MKHRWNSADDDLILYSIVAEEVEAGQVHKGLWLKALSESESDEAKAKAKYSKYRVAAVRKVLPEILELLEIERAELEAAEVLDGRIASAETELIDVKKEYEQAVCVASTYEAKREAMEEEHRLAGRDWDTKTVEYQTLREEMKLTWIKRVAFPSIGAAILFAISFDAGLGSQLQSLAFALLLFFVIAILVIRGPSLREIDRSKKQVARAKMRLLKSNKSISEIDRNTRPARALEGVMSSLHSKISISRDKIAACHERSRLARESIAEKLSFSI